MEIKTSVIFSPEFSIDSDKTELLPLLMVKLLKPKLNTLKVSDGIEDTSPHTSSLTLNPAKLNSRTH